MTQKRTKITIAHGDGIGPEIMDATLKILEAAGAHLDYIPVEMGKKVYESGNSLGITSDAWDSIRENKIILKGPLTTPQGGGYKSVNVTLRKSLGLFANVRSVQTYSPYVASKHDNVDMVIFRENEEDLYAGIEYRQTKDTCQGIKLLTQSGTERFIRYAFEYAKAFGRKRLTCLIKDNIMKMSDGMFHKVFKTIALDYPEIKADSYIVDIGMALVASHPERFDVVVTMNLYGDIVSDIASQVAGSVGLSGSANIGQEYAMFEAIHGSAPDIAGQGVANPSGLLNGALLLLKYIGQIDIADKIENAWLATLEDEKCHTADIAKDRSKALSTNSFADAVIANLGKLPQKLKAVDNSKNNIPRMPTHAERSSCNEIKTLVGVDVYIDRPSSNASQIGHEIEEATDAIKGLKLALIASRGVKVYPVDYETEVVTDLWRCRFYVEDNLDDDVKTSSETIRKLLASLDLHNIEWVSICNLYKFDERLGYSLLQGE